MIRITRLTHDAVKILKRHEHREHRKFHLENARAIRERADEFMEYQEKNAVAIFGYVPDDIKEIIEKNYTNAQAEAIAEENSKCMDSRRH